MKTLVAVFSVAFLAATVQSQEPQEVDLQDPLMLSLVEKAEALGPAFARADAARERWEKTGSQDDYEAHRAAESDLEKVITQNQPSKLDYWEVRQRMMEYIQDSDDATVFELYLSMKVEQEEKRQLRARITKSREESEAMLQKLAAHGVVLESTAEGLVLVPQGAALVPAGPPER